MWFPCFRLFKILGFLFNFYKNCKSFICFKSQYSLLPPAHFLNSLLISSHCYQSLVCLSSVAFCKYMSPLFLITKVAHTIYSPLYLAFSTTFQRPLHINSKRSSSFFLLALCYSIVWMCHGLFNYSTPTGYVSNLLLLQKMAHQS